MFRTDVEFTSDLKGKYVRLVANVGSDRYDSEVKVSGIVSNVIPKVIILGSKEKINMHELHGKRLQIFHEDKPYTITEFWFAGEDLKERTLLLREPFEMNTEKDDSPFVFKEDEYETM